MKSEEANEEVGSRARPCRLHAQPCCSARKAARSSLPPRTTVRGPVAVLLGTAVRRCFSQYITRVSFFLERGLGWGV